MDSADINNDDAAQGDGGIFGPTIRQSDFDVMSENLHAVRFVPGSFVLSKGQPQEEPPVVCAFETNIKGLVTWKIKVFAGRHKTVEPALAFIDNSGGGSHISGGVPKELNFSFGIEVDLKVGEAIATIPMFLGQGSDLRIFNNWHIGSRQMFGPQDGYYRVEPQFDGAPHIFNVLTPYPHTMQFTRQT